MARVFRWKQDGKPWDGMWWIDYMRTDGKRRRERIGPSHALAKEVLAKRLNDTAERRNFPERCADAQRFAAFADRFWGLHGSKLRSPWWRGMMALWVREFGDRRLSEIKADQIQAVYNRIATENKASTANRYFTLLRLMFNCAAKWGDFHGLNPCRAVTRRSEATFARTRYLSEAEIITFLRCCHPRLLPVVTALLLTGMRKGEAFGLDWRDVDFAAGVLTIRQSKADKPRSIPLPGRLRALLLALGPGDAGPVFTLPRVMLYRYFEKARKDSGLEHFTLHSLRHTFASHFAMKTRDLPTLQSILGHSTPILTARYTHLAREHVAAKMAQVEAVIPEAPSAAPALPTLLQHAPTVGGA